MKTLKKILTAVSTAMFLLFVLVYALVAVGGTIANKYSDLVTNFLRQNATNVVKVDVDEDMEQDAEYYKSDFESVKDVRNAGIDWTQKIMEEGAVLLKNENGALPLAKGASISLYGAARPVIGFNDYNKEHVDFDKGLSDAGFAVNQTLFDWYKSSGYGDAGSGRNFATRAINEAPFSLAPEAKNNKADAAIYVISRNGGEGKDLRVRNLGEKIDGDETNGNYLMLSPTELDTIAELKKLRTAGTIGKIIVILNTTNHVAFDWTDGIDAILYTGSVGSAGVKGIANILSEDVNPSGKLSDTLWKNHYLNPVLTNFGADGYDESNASAYQYSPYTFGDSKDGINDGYVVYQEGIYSGYRYTETRYEDAVTGRANTGDYDYNATVAYPFGYGLSYTRFSYSNYSVEYNGETDCYDVAVTVKNDGEKEGRHAVQLFLQKPYTSYDVQKKIEKASAELISFAKTSLLAPAASETVTMSVPRREFASYDSYGERTYILEAGDYYLALGADVHDALNNILAVKKSGGTTVNSAKMKNEKGDTVTGDAAAVKKITLDDSLFKAYTKSVTGKEITNNFDNVDLKLYEGAGEANKNAFEYITRNNWQGTVKYAYTPDVVFTDKMYVRLVKTEQMARDIQQSAIAEHSTEGEMPTLGSTATSWQLIDMRINDEGKPMAYDDPRWDELLNQLTFAEMADLLGAAGYQTRPMVSISKPSTCDEDYDCGCIKPYDTHRNGLATRYDDPDKSLEPAENCDNGIAAATRDLELMYGYGVQWGEDCLWAGLTCLYGAGNNIHRIAYGGRCRGYFSEDPVLMGKCVAQINLGMETKGIKMLLKHCFLNEQETGRGWLSTFANEQSVREIYLRPFQIGIEEGKVQGVMTAMNRIGVVGSMHHTFLNDVLRGEFGMCGYVVTDSYGSGMNLDKMFLAGNDLPLGVGNIPLDWAKYPNIVNAMRVSTHNVLYTIANSNAMNGITSDSVIVTFQPEWQYYLERCTTAALVLMIISVVFFVAMQVWSYFGKNGKKDAA